MDNATIQALHVIKLSAEGERGTDQQRIAEVGIKWLSTLLSKNKDYGSSVWKTPVLCPGMEVSAAIKVRISDKIERLNSLAEQENEIKSETEDDTMSDLGSYCLLYLARPK